MANLRPTPSLSPLTLLRQSVTSRIKSKPEFDDIAADKLTLWRVSVPDDGTDKRLEDLPLKKELRATNKLFMVFDADLPDGTIHVIVERPWPGNMRTL